MGYRETYEMWCTDPYFDDKTKEELRNLAGDEKEIEDRFYRQLEFGTGGLRGMIQHQQPVCPRQGRCVGAGSEDEGQIRAVRKNIQEKDCD